MLDDPRHRTVAILNSDAAMPPLAEAVVLVDALEAAGAFTLGEALCRRLRDDRPAVSSALPADQRLAWRRLKQHQALFTVMDADRRRAEACLQALAVLDSDPGDETSETSSDPETMALAGMVRKRLWQVDQRLVDLERAARDTLRGWACRRSPVADAGIGVTAAFLLDVLAAEDDQVTLPGIAERGAPMRLLASQIRHEVLEGCRTAEAPLSWSQAMAAAEAALGLDRSTLARGWFDRAHALPHAEWHWRRSVRQLAALVDLIAVRDAEAGRLAKEELHHFAGRDAPGLFIGPRQKVGLALSGGGFRAALFHLGVLAALAEADVLRHVEALSCVSGGSIIGAALYLRLLDLAERTDDEATHQDYVDVVACLVEDFEKLVTGGDLRTRALSSLLRLRHTTREVAQLLEERLYARIRPDRSLRLRDLAYRPGRFHPRRDNWRRKAKLPLLVLNATTLNTGHTWQYAVGWMGEAPFALEPDIDSEERYRRLGYDEAPAGEGNVTLGEAVAASAAFPLVFPALGHPRLYPGRTVRLIDGGVADNQGIFSLDEQDCSLMIVSDASVPFQPVDHPPRYALLPPMRLVKMMMGAIRRYQYRLLRTQVQSGELDELVYLQLGDGLEMAPVDWRGARWRKSEQPLRSPPVTDYGMPVDIQRALSRLRTDLNRFHPDEAAVLALSGYRLARHHLGRSARLLPGGLPAAQVDWSFRRIEALLDDPLERAALRKRLEGGRRSRWR